MPLYASKYDLAAAGMAPKLAAEPCRYVNQRAATDVFVPPLYNVSELADGASVQQRLGRPDTPCEPTNLYTGVAEPSDHQRWTASNGPWASGYWVTTTQIVQHALCLQPGVALRLTPVRHAVMFNAQQVQAPLDRVLAAGAAGVTKRLWRRLCRCDSEKRATCCWKRPRDVPQVRVCVVRRC